MPVRDFLTMDIGGTFIKYGVMNENYEVKWERSQATQKRPDALLRQLKAIVGEAFGEVCGIAICMGGFIHPATGENTDYSVGENFRAFNLKEELKRDSGLPVMLENDSNCAALGELRMGAGRGLKNFCMITFGTGIGGAVVLDEKLYRGSNYKAGEVGFTKVLSMGGLGELKAEQAGATGTLVKAVSKRLGKAVDGVSVFSWLDRQEIRDIYREWLKGAAVVAGNMAVTLDPQKLLIGGGISENPTFINDLRNAVYELYPHLEEYTKLVACEQGNRAGRIGALYLLLEQESRRERRKKNE